LATCGEAKSHDIGAEQGSGKVHEGERSLQEETEGKLGSIFFGSDFDNFRSGT
jgi:hypothetical protein